MTNIARKSTSSRGGIWLPSMGKLVLLVIVVSPLSYVSLVFVLREYNVCSKCYFNENMVLHGPYFDLFLLNVDNVLGISVFAMIFVAFPFYTYIFPYICKRFRREYHIDIVIEYQYLKNILWIFISSTIVLTLVPLIAEALPNVDLPILSFVLDTLRENGILYPLSYLRNGSILVVSAALISITVLLRRAEFRFEYAKGCIELVSVKKDEIDVVNYLMKGLGSYDKFIRKRLKTRIDYSDIYSKIINSGRNERNQLIQNVCVAFQGNDKLEVLYHLSLLKQAKNEITSAKDSLTNKLQVLGSGLEWVVTAVTGVVGAVISVLAFAYSK